MTTKSEASTVKAPKKVVAVESQPSVGLAIASLRRNAPRLNALASKCTEAIVRIEDFLDSHGVGIVAHVPLSDHPQWTFLGYQRHCGRFRIGVGAVIKERMIDGFVPLGESSREVKLCAIRALPLLVELLAKTVGSLLEQSATTVGAVGYALDVLGMSGEPTVQ